MHKKYQYLQKLKELTNEEIKKEIIKLKKELVSINFQLKTKQKNSSHMKQKIKTQIAQLNTIYTIRLQNKN